MKQTKKKKKNRSSFLIITVILAFVVIIAGVFFSAYYLSVGKSSNSYGSIVKTCIENINSINDNSSNYIKNQTIDTDKIRKDLSSQVDALNKIKDKLQGLIASEKYIDDQNNLLAGLDKNILIFRQISLIVNNPNSNSLENAVVDLNKYKAECMNSYSSVNLSKVKPDLGTSTKSLIEDTSSYANQLSRAHKDKEIIQSQNMDFINSMEDIIAKLIPIRVDFSSQLSKARDSGSDLDGVISVVNKNKDSLETLSENFSNIIVPSDARSSYEAFRKTLDDYSGYMDNLLYCINNEKLAGGSLSSNKLSDLYTSSSSKFNDTVKDYSDFLKAYSDFKTASLK